MFANAGRGDHNRVFGMLIAYVMVQTEKLVIVNTD